MSGRDTRFMEKALKQATKAAKQKEVPVGAVVVADGKVIAKGYNRREGRNSATAHAEILAIEKACKKLGSWRLAECELYVTLEPCPMCYGAIVNSRIKRLVFGAYDHKAGVCGSLCDLTDIAFNHRPEISGGVMEKECAEILSLFFKKLRAKRKKHAEKPNSIGG